MAEKALGTKFTFATKEIGSLSSISEIGGAADEIDVTTLDSTGGYKEFLQGFKDSGELTLTGFLASGKNQKELIDAYGTGTSSACKITFPSGGNLTFNGYVKGYKIGPADVNGAIGFSATVRITGGVTFAETTTTGGSE